MNKEEKIEKINKAREILSDVFINSKEDWAEKWWIKNLTRAMAEIDITLYKIDKPKPTGIKSGD